MIEKKTIEDTNHKIALLILATGLFSAVACPTPNVGTVPCHALVPA